MATPTIQTMTNKVPLSGTTVLVTRALSQSNFFVTLLENQGATVLTASAIAIHPPTSTLALDDAISRIQEFKWLIFTSTNGIDYF